MANGSNISGAVAVLGGGITGIQAALDLTSMGFKVYLIEKKPAIGGYMAMLDKTFPTNDCSLCILSPKLVECGRHRDIEILTLTEVLGLDGKAGNFTLKLRKNPRYVDEAKCTSCGLCAEKCPVKIPNEYEQGLAFRKAIYKYYPQAIPNSYVVDKTGYPPDFKGCVMCHACEKVCGSGAINLDAEPEDVSLEVGAVILADGADAFNALLDRIDAKGKPNIITLGEIFNLSIRNPVYVGIAVRKATYSHDLIKEQGEFTVNMPTATMLKEVLGCGSCSGRDGIDKFTRFNLTPLPSKYVKPPIIAECPVNLECRVVGFHNVGDHDLFIGDVLLEHVDEDALNSKGERDEDKLNPLIWLGGGFYQLGEKIEEMGL